MVSAFMPPMSVSTFDTEPVLVKSPRVRLSLPEPRLMLSAAPESRAQGDGVVGRATDQSFDVRDRGRVSEVAEGQLVGTDAEVDGGIRCDRTDRDRIGCAAAHQGFDAGDRRRVGEVSEAQAIGAGTEVDRAVRDLAS